MYLQPVRAIPHQLDHIPIFEIMIGREIGVACPVQKLPTYTCALQVENLPNVGTIG